MSEGLARKGFDLDLADGKKSENELRMILDGAKVEVKREMAFKKTGNIAVEFEYRGKPSGIATTDANYWCFKLDGYDTFLLLETDRLRAICRRLFLLGRWTCGGDYNWSKFCLMKLSDLPRADVIWGDHS